MTQTPNLASCNDICLLHRLPQCWIGHPRGSPTHDGLYSCGTSGGEIPEGYIDVIRPGGHLSRILHPSYTGSEYIVRHDLSGEMSGSNPVSVLSEEFDVLAYTNNNFLSGCKWHIPNVKLTHSN